MSEQLSMDIFSDTPPPMEELVEKTYEALDHQLSDLMHALNGDKECGKKNPSLNHCTLEISQHTREGQIALSCSKDHQSELLKTNVVGKAGEYKPLILDAGYLYLRRYWQYQQLLADQINARINVTHTDEKSKAWAEYRLDYYFPSQSGETDWQRVAAERALNHSFVIVSGGPGTGKTTTITRILALLVEQKTEQKAEEKIEQSLKIMLAAPTGKASIRMLDAINEAKGKLKAPDDVLQQMPKQASTIHKLLGYIPEKNGFKHNKNNPLNADVVLIDEASMIDIALMSKLVEAVPAHAKLILIGDKNQLSSVETGSVFADMCEGLNDKQNLVTLKKNWRFAEDSAIGQLAAAVNDGNSSDLLKIIKDDSKPSCNIIEPISITGKNIPDHLISPWQQYSQVLNNPNSSIKEIFESFNQYRILCALRRGLNGSVTMSSRIETELAKQGLIQIKSSFANHNQTNQHWYHGRPVMITQNSYGKGLFNGDTGITLIRNGKIKVYFPDESLHTDGADEFKSLAPVRLPAHETTWAMTIHKSQGSEFDHVTLILPHEVMPLLTRQLIYTGITRAKEQVNIVASDVVLNAGVKTEMVRATNIKGLL